MVYGPLMCIYGRHRYQGGMHKRVCTVVVEPYGGEVFMTLGEWRMETIQWSSSSRMAVDVRVIH